ncbi:helix-turn-helix domain-containing protein [Maribacter sp. R86514]|uniref:helix-turn-helix domain-containing protein n=1 Tax=Maribacter sp. R86514 TaxID=3093854 RepID=UPI0037CC3DB9
MSNRGDFLYESISKNIKELRKAKGLGQENLAELISLSRSSISNIEIGKHQPSIFTIYEIAIALDCKMTDLLPSMDTYQSSLGTIDEKYKTILDSLPQDKSKKSLLIINEILRKNG